MLWQISGDLGQVQDNAHLCVETSSHEFNISGNQAGEYRFCLYHVHEEVDTGQGYWLGD